MEEKRQGGLGRCEEGRQINGAVGSEGGAGILRSVEP